LITAGGELSASDTAQAVCSEIEKYASTASNDQMLAVLCISEKIIILDISDISNGLAKKTFSYYLASSSRPNIPIIPGNKKGQTKMSGLLIWLFYPVTTL
jgi:hypothetical protein